MLLWILSSIRAAGWAPISVFVLHVLLSRVFGAYHTVQDLDMPMHFVGGVAIAYFFQRAVMLPAAKPVLGVLTRGGGRILTFALVCTSTVVWEFAEWTTDWLELTWAQKGLDDTILDMALGVAGGCLLLAVKRKSGFSGS